MESAYWTNKWSENQIGFHQADINKRLIRFWPDVAAVDPSCKVFVPLCGKSRDMLWLHGQGHAVVGVELSIKAAEAFFNENQLQAERDTVDGFEVFRGVHKADGITLMAGDYFSLTPQHLTGCTSFYDRASLIAMPESMREDYANQLASLMAADARGLLLSIAYNQQKMKGPPFSVPDNAVHELLGHSFSIEQLAHFGGPKHVGNLAERGLETLDERVYLLTRNQ